MAMRVFKWYRMAGVAAFLVLAPPAMAQCGGFTDVVDDGVGLTAFCPSVQWVKNRSVTLGCTSPTLYCPTNNVTRLQMAAFMNRLGAALTPVELGTVANDSMVPLNLTGPGQVRCQTAGYLVQNYPRRAQFNNKANLFEATARVTVLAEAVFSTDGGGNWTRVLDSETYQTLDTGGSPPDEVTTYQLGYQDLIVGQTYIFGVRVLRAPLSAGTGNARVYCTNRVQIQNLNGGAPPYDDGYVPPPEDRTGRAARPPGP
jgi:hypothetical protein